MRELPHCDDLFLRFFAPWYKDSDWKRRGFKATLPDVLQDDSMAGLSQNDASPIVPKAQEEVLRRINCMIDAVRGDLPNYLSVAGDIDLSWIDAYDCYYDRDRIHDVIERSEPSDFGNDYVVLCCEFGAALGYVLREAQPRLIWRLDWPYWDSTLLDPKTGTALAVFHWAIKKMSEYGVDDGFAAKSKAALQFLKQKKQLGVRGPSKKRSKRRG